MVEAAQLNWPDYVAIVLYFVVVLGVGLWATFRAKTDSAQGYFLASRSMTWIPIGASTFATNIGAPMFVGIAGSAASTGIAVTMYEWHAMLMLILLGWVFLPVYRASGCFTMPQYMELRFGGSRIRLLMAIIALILGIISQIAGQMYAGALFFQTVFNWNLYAAVGIILVLTAVYTVMGGLTAVIWTNALQTAILVIGGSVVAIIALIEVGGWEAMEFQYMSSAANYTYLQNSLYNNLSCGWPKADAFNLFRPIDDNDFPWTGMTFGLTFLALYAWCTDQICVQRSMSAKTNNHAKAGLVFAAYLKVLSFVFFVIPGIVSRVFYPEEVACANPEACKRICDNANGCSNIAYPLLVVRALPEGVRGLMLAALLAALMSSLTSVFNSTSTIFTMDIWRRLRPVAREGELMIVGRLATVALILISLAWLPVLDALQGSAFWDYIQEIQSYIAPPAVVVFLGGILWNRTSEQGAFWSLLTGLLLGAIRMGMSWAKSAPSCGSGEINQQLKNIQEVHYLHFALISAAVSAAVLIGVSLMTKPRSPKQLRRMTFWTKDSVLPPELDDEEEQDEISHKKEDDFDTEISGQSGFKHIFMKYVCGVDNSKKSKQATNVVTVEEDDADSEEDPFWRKFLNYQAVICGAMCVFLCAFWA